MDDDPLWSFSLDFYRRPGVATACVELQDQAGADVNLVLFVLWCAATRRPLDAAAIAAADARVAPWRRSVIEPLRAVRRAMKQPLLDGAEAAPLRDQVKSIELAAERLTQAALYAAAPPPGDAADPASATLEYLTLYGAGLDRPLPDGAVVVLLEALRGA